jgi:uracil-DNA glycosylase
MDDRRVAALDLLLRDIRACAVCAAALPLGPRPIVQAGAKAMVLIIGQAPGAKVHESGIPWDDPSGERLRGWSGIEASVFYDPERVALMPMGFCYPGAEKGAGDNPPRPECAPLWHARLRAALPDIRLTLLVGQYAQKAYLKPHGWTGMTGAVRGFGSYPTALFPLPHPSWRSTGWMRRNSWFEAETLPALRARVAAALEAR